MRGSRDLPNEPLQATAQSGPRLSGHSLGEPEKE
jgi:hypothetical protein